MRILVVTVVHHPQDARIYFREINALLNRGHQVSFAAAFDSFPVNELDSRIELITITRSSGRKRIKSLLDARRILKSRSIDFDLVLIHDPELLFVASASQVPVVWDVHEDTVAAISGRDWIPNFLKRPLKKLIQKLETNAEKKYSLILAETDYQQRFRKVHTIVPNTVEIKPYIETHPDKSVIYLGSITSLRGAEVLLKVAELIKPNGIKLELVGDCPEPELKNKIEQAQTGGNVIWHGFVPNEQARELLVGKLAGLSLLRKHPNYLVSQPTKIYEYQAAGIPVITTALPHAENLINLSQSGFVVEFDDAESVAERIIELAADRSLWQKLGKNGHEYVIQHHNWNVDQNKFIAALEAALVK